MNINELASSIHQSHYPQHVVSLPHTGQQTATTSQTAEDTKTREFSDILSNYIEEDDKDEEILSAIKDLAKSVENLKTKNYNEQDSDLMSILTDQEKAMEYLSHQSGRNLIVEMAQNSIAGIISGSES